MHLCASAQNAWEVGLPSLAALHHMCNNPRKETEPTTISVYISTSGFDRLGCGHLLVLYVSERDGVCVLMLAGSGEACRRPWEDKPGVWWRHGYRKLHPVPSPSVKGPLALCGTDMNLPDVDWVKPPCFKTHACECSLITLKVTSYSNGAFRCNWGSFFFFF